MSLQRILPEGVHTSMVRRAFQDLREKVLRHLEHDDLNVQLNDHTGADLVAGEKATVRVSRRCRITDAVMASEQVGNLKVDIWVTTVAEWPAADADSICGGSELQLTAAQITQNDLSGWSTALEAGDLLTFNVDSCAGIERAMIHLTLELE